MLFTTHASVGAALGAATGNPYAGFLAGFLSHHIIDALPHFDQGTLHIPEGRAIYLGKEAPDSTLENFDKRDWLILFGDFAASLIIFGILFFYAKDAEWLPILAGALGGVVPDIIGSSPLWSEKLKEKSRLAKKYDWFHTTFHWTISEKDWVVGASTQVTLITASLIYLLSR